MSHKKDPALDDVPADDQMFGSIDGPGQVSKNAADNSAAPASMQLRPAPEKTKSISKKGMMIVFGLLSIVILMLFVGIATTGHVESQQAAAPAEPKVEQSAHGQSLNVAATLANSNSSSTSSNASDPGAASGASKISGSPTPAPGPSGGPSDPNRPPTPREQYLEWLEKHQYDRLRAKWMADQQAYGAKVIDDSAGAGGLMAAAGGLPRMPGALPTLPMPPAAVDGEDDRVLDARRRTQEAARMLAQASATPGAPVLPLSPQGLSGGTPARASAPSSALADRDDRAREQQKSFLCRVEQRGEGRGLSRGTSYRQAPGL